MPKKPERKTSLGRKTTAAKTYGNWRASQNDEEFREKDAKRQKLRR